MRKAHRPVEPQRVAADFIDDLPLRPDGPIIDGDSDDGVVYASRVRPPVDRTTQPIKEVARGPGCVVVLLCAVAFMVTGWAIAAVQYTFSDRPAAEQTHDQSGTDTQPAPAVTVIKTETKLPASCKQALEDFAKYLDAAYAVSGVNNQQLDLMDEANQAILSRDWKALAALTERQRTLERELGPASTKVLPVLITVKEGLKQCQSDAS